jgi:hypothetical protein
MSGHPLCSILDTIHDTYYIPIGTYVLTCTNSSHVIHSASTKYPCFVPGMYIDCIGLVIKFDTVSMRIELEKVA